MDLNKPVSQRQFAKMVGQAESAVRKAVSRQSIVEGRNSEGKIIPAIAAREWGKAILPEFGGGLSRVTRVKNMGTKPPSKTKVSDYAPPKPVRPKKEKPLPVTAEEFLHEDDDALPDDITKEEIEGDTMELTERSTKVDADRVQAIYKAKMAELAYQERRGDMIPRAKMKVLFEYGANIRSAIQGLKSRVLDDILANAHDRQLASMIFEEAIDKTLEELSDPEKLNI